MRDMLVVWPGVRERRRLVIAAAYAEISHLRRGLAPADRLITKACGSLFCDIARAGGAASHGTIMLKLFWESTYPHSQGNGPGP